MNMQEEMSKKSQKIWEYNSPKNVMRRIDSISEVCKKLIPIIEKYQKIEVPNE